MIPVGLAAAALGIGQGAVDAAVALCMTKSQRGSDSAIRHRELVQERLGRAELGRRAGRALLREAVQTAWDRAQVGHPSVEERGAVRLAAGHAAALAAATADDIWQIAGADAIIPAHGIERRFRDIHTATKNVVISADQYAVAGRSLLGFDPPPIWR